MRDYKCDAMTIGQRLLKIPNCPLVLCVGKKNLIKRAEFERYLLENVKI